MQSIERAFSLLHELDKIYKSVIDDSLEGISDIDGLIAQMLEFENVEVYQDEERDIITAIIKSFSLKIELINKIIDFKRDISERMENIRNEFKLLEARRFEIVNNYVVGTVKKEDIDSFEKVFLKFRNKLYAIPISDNNIMEIAKMKSKIQHFETEVLEDEELLRVAYSNSN